MAEGGTRGVVAEIVVFFGFELADGFDAGAGDALVGGDDEASDVVAGVETGECEDELDG